VRLFRDLASARRFAKLPVRVAMIRAPHDRIESTFRMYAPSLGIGSGYATRFRASKPLWLRARHDDQGDPHLAPQVDAIKIANPAEIVAWDFERLAEVLGVDVPRYNASAPMETTWIRRAHRG
jgi:hypothetical protein